MNSRLNVKGHPDSVLHEDHIGDLSILVKQDSENMKLECGVKVADHQSSGMTTNEIARRNLLKGITADENVVVHVSPKSPLLFLGILHQPNLISSFIVMNFICFLRMCVPYSFSSFPVPPVLSQFFLECELSTFVSPVPRDHHLKPYFRTAR